MVRRRPLLETFSQKPVGETTDSAQFLIQVVVNNSFVLLNNSSGGGESDAMRLKCSERPKRVFALALGAELDIAFRGGGDGSGNSGQFVRIRTCSRIVPIYEGSC